MHQKFRPNGLFCLQSFHVYLCLPEHIMWLYARPFPRHFNPFFCTHLEARIPSAKLAVHKFKAQDHLTASQRALYFWKTVRLTLLNISFRSSIRQPGFVANMRFLWLVSQLRYQNIESLFSNVVLCTLPYPETSDFLICSLAGERTRTQNCYFVCIATPPLAQAVSLTNHLWIASWISTQRLICFLMPNRQAASFDLYAWFQWALQLPMVIITSCMLRLTECSFRLMQCWCTSKYGSRRMSTSVKTSICYWIRSSLHLDFSRCSPQILVNFTRRRL